MSRDKRRVRLAHGRHSGAVSQAPPKKVNATMMSASFLALFAGSVLMGWIGKPLARGLAMDDSAAGSP